MCTPQIATTIGDVFSAGMTTLQAQKEAKYNAQIAQTNAQIAIQQGRQQQQTGIEEAREEKIKGMQNANLINARNASGNFDINSKTNFYNYEDAYLASENEAKSIQKTYDQKAQNYFSKANLYLQKSENIISSYNSNLLNTALGLTKKVASSWDTGIEG